MSYSELSMIRACEVKCEHDYNCSEACGRKIITRKQVKDAIVITVKDKWTWLKFDEQCSKHECANERIALDICENKITAFLMSIEIKEFSHRVIRS